MRPFLAVTRVRFRLLLQYRGAALGGFITQVFFGLIYMMGFQAFYGSSSQAQPIALQAVITYVWLNQAFLGIQPWYPDPEVRQLMRTGSVAYELVRPCSLFWFWFARALALRSAPPLLRCVPLLLLAYCFFGLQLPAGWISALWFIVSLLLAVVLSAAITVVLNSSLFWTISGEGITMIVPTLAMALSGQIIPLPLYPDWMQPLIHLLPFRGLIDVPARIYSGVISAEQAWLEVSTQILWSLIILWFGACLVRKGTGRLVIQGG